jgi:OPA family glycerol-3-phosphate transporter-like MFS transporter
MAIFGVSAVSSLILYVVNVLYPDAALIPSLILMSLTVACMHGINLMLIAIVPKAFVKCGKVSTYSGILNACTYVGASISTYGFAAIAEQFDWNFTILTWIGISAIGLLLCALAAPIWKKFKAE